MWNAELLSSLTIIHACSSSPLSKRLLQDFVEVKMPFREHKASTQTFRKHSRGANFCRVVRREEAKHKRRFSV